ncbi:MAG TPA: ABC transporter ATP-binding protein [Pyrinomonadaceae bacterium]|nr:ABC transporter ATP-binding protein [Pyrinomonadaceae bacterium]
MQVISAEKLSKRYVLGSRQPYSFREMLAGMFDRGGTSKRELWALRDVSFSVGEGERLGLIGHNGAGKSTLLKILSRITKPTSGTASISGRVGSLLEVGTGFHSELSGRENIYLNGAILGMRRAEIERNFDEIVAFSEIEAFLDTPVKHYSTGMHMRLAFSVAAHLDPEVLIVDEVLAVGDVRFQRKCLRKMREVGESGRTVIFVSHDMQSITRLCDRVIWLKDGEVKSDGEARHVVSEYLHEQSQTGAERIWNETEAPGNEAVRLRSVRVRLPNGSISTTVDIRSNVMIEMQYEVLQPGRIIVPGIQLNNEQGACIFVSHDWNGGRRDSARAAGVYESTVTVPGNLLSEGTVFVTVGAATYQPHDIHFSERDAVTFNVIDSPDGDAARGDFVGPMPGVVRPVLEWKTETKK